jgi:hypothetical protein
VSIFTAASIHHYETEKNHEDKAEAVAAEIAENKYGLGWCVERNYHDDGVWMRRMRMLIDSISKSKPYDHGYDNVPVLRLDGIGRWCRLRAVREERKGRLRIDAIMKSIHEKWEAQRGNQLLRR